MSLKKSSAWSFEKEKERYRALCRIGLHADQFPPINAESVEFLWIAKVNVERAELKRF